MRKLILFVLTIFFISCSSDDTTDFVLDQNLYEDNKLEDYELFEKSNVFISSNELDLALKELDKIEVLFPSSPYANKSMLLSAYIYFLKKDYEKTRAIAQNYKKYYPGNKNIVYANYLDAMTYYVLIKKPDYSQRNAHKALDKFNFIINAYPNSRYEIDIITRLKILDNTTFGDINISEEIRCGKITINKQFKNKSAEVLSIVNAWFVMKKEN